MSDLSEEKRKSDKEKIGSLRENASFLITLDIMRGILGALGLFEDEDLLDFMDDITVDDIVFHPVFIREVPDFHDKYPSAQSTVRGAESGDPVQNYISRPQQEHVYPDVFADETTSEAAIRAALSISMERYTEQSMARGVGYKMGAKGEGNAIDCSGFVQNVVRRMTSANPDFSGQNLTSAFANHSDGQVTALARMTNFMLKGDDVNMDTLKAGMVIGIDSGDKKWDRGRTHGIDHVGIVYMDTETRQLMFAESRSGKGVTAMPLEDWLKKADAKGYNLYASDIVKLASEDYKLQIEEKIKVATAAQEPKAPEVAAAPVEENTQDQKTSAPTEVAVPENTVVAATVPPLLAKPV